MAQSAIDSDNVSVFTEPPKAILKTRFSVSNSQREIIEDIGPNYNTASNVGEEDQLNRFEIIGPSKTQNALMMLGDTMRVLSASA